MKSYFPSWSKKQCIHTKLSRKVQRNSHFHMTMSTPILKHYHSLSVRFVYNPECLKAIHCHLIPSRLDNAMVFCRISAEARLPYMTLCISFFYMLIHRVLSCGHRWRVATLNDRVLSIGFHVGDRGRCERPFKTELPEVS